MSKATCSFIFPKGKRKSEICGKNCLIVEGKENRCAQHKENYLARKTQLVQEHNKGKYITKNYQISNLDFSYKKIEEQCESQKKSDYSFGRGFNCI